ncbi:MAG: hypothetical protein ABI960_03615 [Candidatus Eisenbacteria bacterium]
MTLRRFGSLLLVLAALFAPARAHAVGAVGDLFITSDASNLVRAYGGASGVLIGTFTNSVNGSGELGIHFGAANGRVLVGHFGGGVDEFDASTGAFIKTYAPGGGWQWAGLYAPNGNVYIGSQLTGDVREYDVNTGAFVRVLCSFAGAADMEIAPNGHLFICGYTFGNIGEFDATTGALISTWSLPSGCEANDILFLPGNGIFVTASRCNLIFRFNGAHAITGTFTGTGMQRPHGIAVSPYTGNILVADGVTTQVHEFDPNSFVELNPAFRSPPSGDKIVDIAFRPAEPPTPAATTTWGRLKGAYR